MIKDAILTPDILTILRGKGTEPPFSSGSVDETSSGTLICRGCGRALYRTEAYFKSGCGWPSFDQEVEGAVAYVEDADGVRTEIQCMCCHAHLGHVFHGERFTAKNVRHCVNGLAVELVADKRLAEAQDAIFAAGCFWGVQHLFAEKLGVLKTEVGYTGGHIELPSYQQVCQGDTGHLEAVRVVFDPLKIDYASLVKFFFEIHNPEQSDGQGPDIGPQYKSAIYYLGREQLVTAEDLKQQLIKKGCSVVTQLEPAKTFWPAEEYHQHYYAKTGHAPYCHRYQKRF